MGIDWVPPSSDAKPTNTPNKTQVGTQATRQAASARREWLAPQGHSDGPTT